MHEYWLHDWGYRTEPEPNLDNRRVEAKRDKVPAEKAEKLIRNLVRRLEADWNGVYASILEGLDEMLTVTKLGLPRELRRSFACTNIIENIMGAVRRVYRNVNTGARHPWRCAGLPPPCKKQRRASVD